MLQKLQKKNYAIAVTVIALCMLFSVTQASATVTFPSITTTAGINTLSDNTTYEKSIAISVVFTPYINVTVENVTSPVIRFYAQKSVKVLVLASTTETVSAFVNNTEQSKTTTIYIDEDSVAGQELEGSDSITVWAKIYNGTVATANYLGGDSTSVNYGALVNSGSSGSGSGSSWQDTVIDVMIYGTFIAIGIAGIVLIAVCLVAFKRARLD